MPQSPELAQFDSIKSDYNRAHREWEKARPKAASVFSRIQPKAKKRKLGVLDGRFKIPEDFNAPLPDDVLAAFKGMG